TARIAAAGPLENKDEIHLTNAHWKISRQEIEETLGGSCVLFNDLEAVACALPYLGDNDRKSIGYASAVRPAGNLLAINIGTGFGSAVVRKSGGRWIAAASESGHMTFSARTEIESSLLPHVESIEDILSGSGL